MAFAGTTRADRDLRDAFRAIKLMRADLEQTRAEKRHLEVTVARWGQLEAAAREAALMREEDFQAQLERITRAYEAQLAVRSVISKAISLPAAPVGRKRRVQSNDGSAAATERPESGSDDEEEQENAAVRAHFSTEDATCGNQFDNDDDPKAVREGGALRKDSTDDEHDVDTGNDNNHEEKHMMRLLTDEMAQEKLQLQAENRRLSIALEERTSELLEERAKFAEVKADLELSLEESAQDLADMTAKTKELASEKQFVEEKYEFLHTELDILKQDQRELKEKLRTAEDAKLELQQTIDDMRATHQLETISIQNTRQTERAQLADEIEALKEKLASSSSTSDAGLVEQIQHELAAMGEQLERRDSEIAKLREELTHVQDALHSARKSHGSTTAELQTKLESYSQTSMILKGQLVEKEEELARLRVNLREQEEALRASRSECADLHDSLRSAHNEHDAFHSTLEHQADEAAAAYSSLQSAFQEQEAHLAELNHDKHELEAEMEAIKLTKEQLAQELESTKQELHQAQEEASARHDELSQFRGRCGKLEQDLLATSGQLERVLSEQECAARVAEDMKRQLEQQLQDAHAANVALSGQLSETQTQAAVYEQEYKNLSMEKKALQQEVRQVKQSAKHAKDELANLQSRSGDLELQLLTLQRQDEAARAQLQAACRHLEAFETRTMELEDRRQLDESDAFDALLGSGVDAGAVTRTSGHAYDGDGAVLPAAVWSVVKHKIAELGKFLPHLQSFAVFLDDALCACESNATALGVLCAQLEQADSGDATTSASWRPSLLQDVVAFVRFACQLQHLILSRQPEFVKHVRRFHRRVFEVMAHWYEVTDHDEIPAPPVAIASREVALILANWTRDMTKRVSTRQWLEQVEAISGANLDTSSSEGPSTHLGVDGTTLVLDDMTGEVKQAFLMLVVPILRRNPAVFVRVFTRLVSPPRDSTRTTIAMLEDKRWEMKIHVQPSTRATSTTASSSMHAPVLSLETASAYGFERSPVSPSSVSSSSTSSSATSFASARLQIIQERLQRMQSR